MSVCMLLGVFILLGFGHSEKMVSLHKYLKIISGMGLLLLLGAPAAWAGQTKPEAVAEIPIRVKNPWALSLNLGIPNAIGLSLYHSLDTNYALGVLLNALPSTLLGLSGRYYFLPDDASPYLQTDVSVNFISNFAPLGRPTFNLMLGWEYRAANGSLLNLAAGLCITPILSNANSNSFIFPSFDLSFGNFF